MNKIITVLIVVIAVFAVYTWWPRGAEAPVPTNGAQEKSVEEFVRENISQLSPEPAVLGGTYYVTDITTEDGRGTVSYEDGHVAHTADFTYVRTDEGDYQIVNFQIRENE